jgi:hypothetical protein
VLAEQDAENGIAAQLVMVDEVLIAPRQAENALRDQGLHFMQHVGAMAPVAKARSEAIDESNGLVRLPEQQRPRVRGDHAPSKFATTRPLPAFQNQSRFGELPRIGITRSRKTKLYLRRHRCASAP